MNRRDLLLGTLGFGALNLSGCICLGACNTSGIRRSSPTMESSSSGWTIGVPTHLYYDKRTLVFFMPYGWHFVADGDFDFEQLPESLWRKVYSYMDIVHIKAIVRNEIDIYEVSNSGKYFGLMFVYDELNKQERNLLQQLFGDKIKEVKGDKISNTFVEALSNATLVWEIDIPLPSMQLFGSERMVHLFDDKNDFQTIQNYNHFDLGDERRNKEWNAKNPTPLIYQSDGSLLYNGKRLTKRLDKLVKMGRKRLLKKF